MIGTRLTQDWCGPQLDVRDGDAVDRMVASLRPDVVVNTAYRQSGDGMLGVNVSGGANVASAAASAGARLIHLSTDLVLDGDREVGGYRESDVPAPITGYGTSKARG